MHQISWQGVHSFLDIFVKMFPLVNADGFGYAVIALYSHTPGSPGWPVHRAICKAEQNAQTVPILEGLNRSCPPFQLPVELMCTTCTDNGLDCGPSPAGRDVPEQRA